MGKVRLFLLLFNGRARHIDERMSQPTRTDQGVSETDMLTESPQPQSDSSGRVFVSINGENDSLDLFPTEARQSSAPIEPAGPHELFVAEAAPIPPLSSSRPRQAAPRRLLGITEIAVLGIVVAAAIGVGVVLSEPNRGRNDTAVPAPAPASASATMNEKPVTVAH